MPCDNSQVSGAETVEQELTLALEGHPHLLLTRPLCYCWLYLSTDLYEQQLWVYPDHPCGSQPSPLTLLCIQRNYGEQPIPSLCASAAVSKDTLLKHTYRTFSRQTSRVWSFEHQSGSAFSC